MTTLFSNSNRRGWNRRGADPNKNLAKRIEEAQQVKAEAVLAELQEVMGVEKYAEWVDSLTGLLTWPRMITLAEDELSWWTCTCEEHPTRDEMACPACLASRPAVLEGELPV